MNRINKRVHSFSHSLITFPTFITFITFSFRYVFHQYVIFSTSALFLTENGAGR